MSRSFSDDELRDLIASSGRGAGAPGRPDGAFEHAPMSYDFRRPQPIDKAASRLIEGVHEQFARLVSGALGSTLRLTTDVDLAFTDQTTYSEFTLTLPSPCCAYSFVLGSTDDGAVIHLSPDLVSAVIDRSFGGKGSALPGDPRQLTQIETNILNRLANRLISDLETAWGPLMNIAVSDVVFESNPELIRVADPSDQVLSIAFEANFGRTTGLVQLCYPVNSLHPVLKSGGDLDQQGQPPPPLSPALSRMKVPVTVRVARGKLPLAEIAKLSQGDVIKLDTTKGEPAVVFIGNQPKFLGRPGLNGRHRAVEIIEGIPASDESRYS